MNFIESIQSCFFKKYFDFKGRASRSEFWYFMLFYYGLTFILYFMSGVLNSDALAGLGMLFYFLIGLIPALAACVRRLHDINKTGFAVLVQLIPFIGTIIFIIWAVTEGDKKKNYYGPRPKK